MLSRSAILFFLLSLSCYAGICGNLMEVDLGTVSNQKIVEHEFEFAGEIKNVMSLCECIEVSTRKNEVSSKKYLSVVKIIFDPKNYVGETAHDVILVDTQDRVTRLTIKAIVETVKDEEVKIPRASD